MSDPHPEGMVPEASSPSAPGPRSLCFSCGGDLSLATVDGPCPECGTPARHALAATPISQVDPAYLRKVRSGISLVLTTILLSLILASVSMLLSEAKLSTAFEVVAVLLVVALLLNRAFSLYGSWRMGAIEPGAPVNSPLLRAARNLRRCVLLLVGAGLLELIVDLFIPEGTPSPDGTTEAVSIAGGVSFLFFSLVTVVLYILTFLSQMSITQHFAARLGDTEMFQNSRRYKWMLPLLSTVGILLLGFGPLIALVLYWTLLNRLRKHLAAVLQTGQPASFPPS